MKILQTYLLLFVAALLLSGFSWGFATDPCKESLESIDTLKSMRDDTEKRQVEAKILSQCPDGAAAHFVTALQKERVSNFDGAIEEYRLALHITPTFPRASGNLGLLYVQKGMNDEASVELSRGISSIYDPSYHKALAQILTSQKIYPLAIYHFNEATRELKDDASIFSNLGDIYYTLKQPEKSLKEYKRALTLDPGLLKAHIGIAKIYQEQNAFDKALEQLKKGETASPQNREIHLMMATIYEKNGDAKLADYHSLLGGKNKLVADIKTTAVNNIISDPDKEIEKLRIAIREHPEDTLSYEKLGERYTAAGRDAEAMEVYREAAHRKSTNPDVYLNLGILHEKKSQIDEAVVAYKLAIKADPKLAVAHLKLGDIRFSRGLFKEAVEQYSEFLKLRPASPDIHLKLARIFVKNKELGSALSAYTSVLTYSPEDGDANREIAGIYAQKGDSEKASAHYKKALALHKGDGEARTALIAIYVKNKQYDEITVLLKEAAELSPGDPINHYKLGLIYDFKKEYENAVASYKKAIELKPDNARALNALGRLYMKTGRLSEAKETLEAAKKADPTIEETSILLNNIRDEFNPEPRKIIKRKATKHKKNKAKKSKVKKSKKSRTKIKKKVVNKKNL